MPSHYRSLQIDNEVQNGVGRLLGHTQDLEIFPTFLDRNELDLQARVQLFFLNLVQLGALPDVRDLEETVGA